ncbi:hypothetical protein OS493_036616 [Desmophyllum pertusum]|uniref:Uncharacterized protein n=1 Tax=Desmophyllum pertusum TaxID=174260 RepID=A0A9X0D1F8_9CNID|nr:hypothetical protein OS493_036616 [Desmophyllum pertusum]
MCDAIHIATMSLSLHIVQGLRRLGLCFRSTTADSTSPHLNLSLKRLAINTVVSRNLSTQFTRHVFCLPIEFAARFVHTFFPTHIRERVNLALKLVLLIFDHELLLKLLIDLGIT